MTTPHQAMWAMRGAAHQGEKLKDHTFAPGTLQRVLGFARPFRREIIVFLLLTVVSAVIGVATPLLAGSELVLIGATLLNAAMWATLGGIGITVAQDLYPTGIGMASSLYFSAIRFSAAIGGVAGGLGVGWFGVPGVFGVPAALCLVAAAGLAVQAVVRQRAVRAAAAAAAPADAR